MAVTTKKQFAATTNATTTVFSPVSIQLNNQDDLDVYVTLSGGTRVLQLRQSTGSTAQSSHPQVNNTNGLYFPAVSAGTNLYNYQLSSDNNTITFNSALPSGAVVFCERRTRDADSSYTSFASGSTIRATDLNNSSTESNFTAQDGRNKVLDIENAIFGGTQPTINGVAQPFVDSAKIIDGSIASADIANNAIITDKIANDAVTMAKLGSGSLPTDITVSGSNIVDLSVNTDDIANGAVTTPKIAADAVDGTKIADDAVDSEHIAADSLDTEHYAPTSIDSAAIASDAVITSKITDANVTTTKIADSNVTLAKLANDLKQTTVTDDDTKLPTSGAIVDYVANQLSIFGGFTAIANETQFPNVQKASGAAVSISDAAGLVVNGSGTSTSGTTVGGSTVTINNIPSSFHSSTVASGVRFIVTSTGSGQIYNYHKATLPESDLVNLSGDINDFAERYRVGGSNPTTALDGGDLFFNTTTGKLLVYNNTTSAWEEAQSIGNFFISTFSESFDGSRQDFTLSNAPTSAQQIILSINGVIQKPNAGSSTPSEGFALSSSTVKLSAAPATGSTYHAVVMGSTVNIGTPSNNTVTTAILQDNAVATAKIADDAVTAAKLANNAVVTASILDDNVTNAKLATNCVTNVELADQAVTLDKITHGTSSNNGKFLRANNGAYPSFETIDLTALSASNLTSGTVPDARFPATLPAASAANLTSIPAANITGTLPAISGANLTGVSSPEVYGFKTTGSELQVTTTNGGADNISGATFDTFEDVVLAATGFSFSVNANGKLIATI